MTAPREAMKHMSHRILRSPAPLLLACRPGPRANAACRPSAVPQAQAAAAGFERVVLTAGRSTVLATDFDITRIAVTNPAVADAVVVQPREILIDGKAAGTVSLIIWGRGAARTV